MMPSTPQCASRRQPGRTRRRAGFTLTEMLVVIGIVVLVLSIATPMVTRAWRAGDRSRTAADLAAIAAALEAYKTDHGDYPRVTMPAAFNNGPTDFTGARMLCRALIAPGPGVSRSSGQLNNVDIADGAGVRPSGAAAGAPELEPGPGFRTRLSPGADNRLGTMDDVAQGPVYGPYLPPDRFKMGDASGAGQTQPGHLAILDRYNRPILYYPAHGKPNVRKPKGLVAEWNYSKTGTAAIPMYNVTDNAAFPLASIAPMLGDLNANGMIDPTEQPATEAPFLLWCAGPDETFGPDQTTMNSANPNLAEAVRKSDDITNIRN